MRKILVIEDSLESYNLVQRALQGVAKIEWAKTRAEAARILEAQMIDLILLDINLPDGDGFQLCSLLQAQERWHGVPVILLTARNSVMDKVLGFSVGADDFICKPFDAVELRARVDSKLQRRQRRERDAELTVCGTIEIDKRAQRAVINENGQSRELGLTPIEFKILSLLASKPDQLFTRDQILDTVWGANVHVYARSVDTHVSKLRAKLNEKSAYIDSVHGAGYRCVIPEGDRMQRLEQLAAIPTNQILQLDRFA